jgi:hypothetical protein
VSTALVEKEVVDFIFDRIDIDLSPLTEYDAQKSELTTIDIVSGPLLMRNFLQAHEEAMQISIKVKFKLDQAIDKMKHEEARAILERAPAYFEENDVTKGRVKDSKSLRDTYVQMDKEYAEAREQVNALKALSKFIENKADSFRIAHDDAKKIWAQLNEGPYARTPYETIPSGENSRGEDNVIDVEHYEGR